MNPQSPLSATVWCCAVLGLLPACVSPTWETDDGAPYDTRPWMLDGDPFADRVVLFEPGEGAGFGARSMPDIVLGPPEGAGNAGSLDVVSLGRSGVIVLEFIDVIPADGPGADFIVFENPFPGWLETGRVEVSIDGETWLEFPCDAQNETEGFPGCAGIASVWSNIENGIDPTDPSVSGGDLYDLADVGLSYAKFVRITDSGENTYEGIAGGFDLDAMAVVNRQSD